MKESSPELTRIDNPSDISGVCSCGDWINIDVCLRLSAWVVDAGLVEAEDEGDLAVSIAKYAARLGSMTNADVSRVRAIGGYSLQKELLQQYARFIETTNDTHKRSDMLRQMGVSQSTMARWARRHMGRSFLQGKGPKPAWQAARAAIEQHGPLSYNDVARIAGLSPYSVTAVLYQAYMGNRLKRRKGPDGRFLYYI